MQTSEVLSVGSLVLDEINAEISVGGAAINVASNLRNLGVPSSILTATSEDAESTKILSTMNELGIMVHSLPIVLERLPKCVIRMGEDGKEIGYDWHGNGVEEAFQASNVDRDFIQRFPQVYLAICENSFAERLARVIHSDQILSFNPGSRVFESISAFRNVLMRANFVFLNEKEYGHIVESGFAQDLHDLILRQDQVAVITRGSKETLLVTAKGIQSFIPENVSAIDETGAGDSFASAFLWAYSKGMPFEKCVRLGNLLASFVVQQIGTQISVVTRDKFITEAKSRNLLD